MESCPHVLFRGGACFTYSPNDQHAGFSLQSLTYCGQELAREQRKREESVTSQPAGSLNQTSNNGAPVAEVLSVLEIINIQKTASVNGNKIISQSYSVSD